MRDEPPETQSEKTPVPKPRPKKIDCRRVELDGVRYVILRESMFNRLCESAGIEPDKANAGPDGDTGIEWDRASLSQKLIRRRRAAGLSQAQLARLSGIRPETLNRIERGHTTPDFATVRKLVVAMNEAEASSAERKVAST